MGLKALPLYDLENRLASVIVEYRARPSKEVMQAVGYWGRLYDAISQKGDFEEMADRLSERLLQDAGEVDFPSNRQLETIATIVEQKRLIIGDKPGTRKTASALIAKYAIEDGLGEKVKTLIVCPGYIMSHWIKEINFYAKERKPKIVPITTDNKEYALKQAAGDADFILISYDMIYRSLKNGNGNGDKFDPESEEKDEMDELVQAVMAEQKIPKKEAEGIVRENATKIVEQLRDTLIRPGKKCYVIADEFHHVKNGKALRARALRRVAEEAPYLVLMSGTKTPYDLNDIANIASILCPKEYEDAAAFKAIFDRDPQFVKAFYTEHEKKPVLTEKHIGGLPELANHENTPTIVNLNELQQAYYTKILADKDMTELEKLYILRMILANPRAILPSTYAGKSKKIKEILTRNCDQNLEDALKKEVSGRFKAVADMAREKDGKLVVFTYHTTGIVDELAEYLRDEGFGAVSIKGSVSANTKPIRLTKEQKDILEGHGLLKGQKFRSELSLEAIELLGLQYDLQMAISDRDKVIAEFQTNPDVKILVAGRCLQEGRSLTAGNTCVLYERNPSVGAEWQMIARLYRSGQQKPVDVHYLHAPGTVDEGLVDGLRERRIMIEAAETGTLAKIPQKYLKDNFKHNELMRMQLMTPRRLLSLMAGELAGKGWKAVKEYLEQHGNNQRYAATYAHEWDYSYSGHTTRLLHKIIEDLGGIEMYKSIADIGSGPAVLSRQLGKALFSLDINPYQLANGRFYSDKLVHGRMDNIPACDNAFDMLVSSLSLHYEAVELTDEELEKAALGEIMHPGIVRTLEEFYRVTKDKLVIALPKNIIQTEEGAPNLILGLQCMGFDTNHELSGAYNATRTLDIDGNQIGNSGYKSHIFVATKNPNAILNPYAASGYLRSLMFKETKSKSRIGRIRDLENEPEPEPEKVVGFRKENSDIEFTADDQPPIDIDIILNQIESGNGEEVLEQISRLTGGLRRIQELTEAIDG